MAAATPIKAVPATLEKKPMPMLQVPAAREAHQQHGLGHPWMLDGGDRPAAQHGVEAPEQFLSAMGAGEDVDIVPECGHGLQHGYPLSVTVPRRRLATLTGDQRR
jgi:hypothetical protein